MSNRLANEKSPYLLQHADNPVDWRPWDAEALAQAAAEQKPIFLSIGYAACHWCHVMAHESFEDPEVAALLNRNFVPVKVDREERPDLDRIYMTYVQQVTGQGGWPLNVWLTPEGLPFYGGTYFPLSDHPARPGFAKLLKAVAGYWKKRRAEVEGMAAETVAAMRETAAGGGPSAGAAEDASASLEEAVRGAVNLCFQQFYEEYDAEWGGFGVAPKFPRASGINFLLHIAFRQGTGPGAGAVAAEMAGRTLQKMAEGGLHDHLGGGFHRYSVDVRWHVPHFEKMLFDQAQIAFNCLEAKQVTGREVFAWVARGIFDYVQRDLTSPRGAFYSAEDADSLPDADETEPVEGAFYVWTRAEIENVLEGLPAGGATAADFFCAHFGVKSDGNVHDGLEGGLDGQNVLMQQRSLAATAREFRLETEAASDLLLDCLGRLRVVRAQRPRPQLDDKVITAWNGLMISALAKGAQVLGADAGEGGEWPSGSTYLARATRAAEFLRHELYDGASGTLYRSWRQGRGNIRGFAEDYAYLIQGLLDLYEAGFEIRWLQWAEELQHRMDEHFWDAGHGAYFNSRADDATVIVRLREDYDGAAPAPSSVAVTNLLRLESMVGDGRGVPSTPAKAAGPEAGAVVPLIGFRDRAFQIFEALRPQWSQTPHALPQMLCGFELAAESPCVVVLAGDPRAADFRALAAVLGEKTGPRRVTLCADGAEGQVWLAARKPYLAYMKPLEGRAAAYVCKSNACLAQETEPAGLRRLLG